MHFTNATFFFAVSTLGLMQAMDAGAATLNAGDRLTIGTSSFFAVDMDADSNVDSTEKTVLSQGTTGIVIGAPNHAPGAITAPWLFLGAVGYDWTTGTAVSGGTAGLDMSGWVVNWNGQDIALGTGAWQVMNASSGMPTSGYSNGAGIFNWSGAYGDSYTLDYTATVQDGAFINVQWALHLEGTVAPVPEASTYSMMLAGIGLVWGIARRSRLTDKNRPG